MLPAPCSSPAAVAVADAARAAAGRQSTDRFPSPAGRQRIVRRVGPERIETGWWRGRSVARDYYRVETAAGRCYWVFRRLPAGPWFLHGMFD